ncbi:MAG: EAL domain-containing protein [Desulfofustis sp.]|jgi:diguanylate cyclase (GGDEF)-like protein/PAS domain S-box-containing protein
MTGNDSQKQHSQNNFTNKILADKIDNLYSSNLLSTVAHLFCGFFYVCFQFPYHQTLSLIFWFGAIVIVYVFRYFLVKTYFEKDVGFKERPLWLIRFRFVSLAVGLIFGSTIIFFHPYDSVPNQMFTVLLLAGLAAGALTVLVADYICYTGYAICLLAPVVAYAFFAPETLNFFVAFLVLIYLFTLTRASKRLNAVLVSSLHLRYENLSLVEDLEEEKNQLNNRLGRILNDSSNELYIVDADNLNCLQFNKGALDNLGYTVAELSEMTLDDIIVDLSKEEILSLVAPLQLGGRESLTYKTLQKRHDGSTYPVELRIQYSAQEDPPVYVVTALDITERDEAEKKLIHQANFDQLTNLPNRYYMLSYIRSAFARAKRQNSKVALLYLDLNNFKDINDTLGHATGDELLKMVAHRILLLLRETDTAARMGGDEFLVLLEGLNRQEQAEIVVHKIIGSFSEPFFVNSSEIYTSASIGISTFPDDGNSVELLMQYADTAMYYAKKDSSTHYRFFSHELRAYIDEQLAIENRLRHAIKNDELFVYYQPKIDTKTERVVGAEALVRWQNKDLGMVPPSIFIPVAEKYGLIEEIGSWVIETACKEAVVWKEHSDCDLQVAINISPRQFRSSNFLNIVDRALELSGLEDSMLEIEITENLLMQDAQEPLEILNKLLDRNITLSLDDFGTGYSSLSYLKQFPLQVLKIDRSFINDMMENQYNMSLVDAIIAMAQILDLRLVAEGVETREQFDFLKSRKVEVVQGYLFSPAIPAEKFREYIQMVRPRRAAG